MNAHKHTASNLRACITALLEDEERGHSRKHLDDFLSELANASNAHLSQSTRPEPSGGSVGGQYSVDEGNARSYLKNAEGFTVAQTHTWGESGLLDLRKLASDLNQLEALRVSHGELYAALEALRNRYVANFGNPDSEFISCITPPHRTDAKPNDKTWSLWDTATESLQRAYPLTKTPTAAPQGQQ